MSDDSYSRWLETLDAQTDAGETVDPRELHDQELADADARTDKTAGRCPCGARETGWKHPGHRYRCPRYAKNPTRADAA